MGIRDDDPEQADDRAVGRRGARFPNAKQRQRFGTEPDPPEAPDPPAGPGPEEAPESRGGSKPRRVGARYPPAEVMEEVEGSQWQERDRAEPPPTAPATPPAERPKPPPPRTERVLAAPDNADESSEHRLRVRPYVITKGRTRARQDLGVETLISTVGNAPWDSAQMSSEYLAVRRLCMQPRSVAEVAAVLSVPLGVARVLLSDLADGGFVHVHTTRFTAGGRPDHVLMRRVLEGLQKL